MEYIVVVLFGIIIALLVFFMFLILKKTVDKVNEQTKSYFVGKLQVYDGLINEKEEQLNKINEQIENNKAKLNVNDDTSKKNNYTFDHGIIDLMNKTDYQHPDVLKLNKKIDNEFDIDFVDIIKEFIDKIDLDNNYDFYVNLRNKFTSKTIYELRSQDSLKKALEGILTKEELEVFDEFKRKRFSNSLNDFLSYLDELITDSNPNITVLVGNKNMNFDYLSKYVKTIVADDIYKGIKIIYKNKVYDFSLNERNV